MKLDDRVCSLELSIRLKELGVPQDSIWYWRENNNPYNVTPVWELFPAIGFKQHYSAFTVAELGELLPKQINHSRLTITRLGNRWEVDYKALPERRIRRNMADSLAEMLVYLLENKLMEAQK